MSISENTASDLVRKVYDAALDDQEWSLFLDGFARAVGGCSAILRSTDVETHKAEFVASVGYDPAWQAAYCGHFVKLDYMTPALSQFKLGEVSTSDQIFSLPEQQRTEFFNDYCIPQDKMHGQVVVLARDGSRALLFAAQRSKRAGAFGEKQARLMRTLAPHVARAVQLHRKFSAVAVEKEWALGALDQLRVGVILANRSGSPLFINRTAELMIAQFRGINVCQGRLVLKNASDTALLHKLIAGATQSSNGAATGGDMRIALGNRTECLHCVVTPVSPQLSARLDMSAKSGCAAIFLSKPGSLQLPPKRLAVLYGLTPAESRLAAKLAAFNSLEQAANDLGIATCTARTQLGAVFAKTGARGQAELLMLLATGTLAHCRED